MLEWIGIVLAGVAVYVAWRANQKSDDANTIAQRALSITEAEHQHLERERAARAQLFVSAQPGW